MRTARTRTETAQAMCLPAPAVVWVCLLAVACQSGCSSGLRSFGLGKDTRPEFVREFDRREREGLDDPFVDTARTDREATGEEVTAGVDEAPAGEWFENLPAVHESEAAASSAVVQAGHAQERESAPTPPPRRSRAAAGLGQVSPWSGQKYDQPDRADDKFDVSLSFDDGTKPSAAGHSISAAPQGPADPLPSRRLRAEDFAPPGAERRAGAAGAAEPDASGFGGGERTDGRVQPEESAERRDKAVDAERRWGFDRRALNIFGGGDDDESPEADEAATDQKQADDERNSLRGRFSRLGARFGLGGDEPEPQPRPREPVDENELARLIAAAEGRIRDVKYGRLVTDQEREEYLRDHVNLRLFYLVDDQHERALDAIPGIPPAEQEFWQQMFWSLAQYRNAKAVPDRTERITQTVTQLRSALFRLQETARLQLRNVTFCSKISGYGDYVRFDTDEFRPGQPVLVYAEIDNFKSEPTSDGRFRTVLRSTLEILPEHGGDAIDSVTLRGVEDVCRNPRRDYFHSYEFAIPNEIAPGRYVLQLTIDDTLSGKTSQETIGFTIR